MGSYPGPHGRKRAIALKAADAGTLIKTSLPFVLKRITPAQLGQAQKVLDAVVVNPAVQKEYEDLMRKSITAHSGRVVNRDPRIVQQANRVLQEQIPEQEADKHIRLDLAKLLAADALKPITDNPDEAAYLAKVRRTLESKGVWLRFDYKLVRNPTDPGRWMVDPRTFQAWLCLDYNGDSIPTKTGELTRDALLGTTALGAGYYQEVHEGKVQKALKKEITRLTLHIEEGVQEHDRLIARHRNAVPGVAEISNLAGGADLPDRSIWDYPHKLIVKALEMNVGGNVMGSQAYLIVAAIATRNAAELLATYAEKSSAGAGGATTVLKVLKTAGEIAVIALTVTGVVGLARGAVARGGAAAESSVDDLAAKVVNRYVANGAKNPEAAAEAAADLAQFRLTPQPKGSMGGGVKPGTSAGHGTGFQKW